MQRSTNRILVTHAGSLVLDLRHPPGSGGPADVRRAITEAIVCQVRCGVDVINDGGQSAPPWPEYGRTRLGGIEWRSRPTGEGPAGLGVYTRDLADFGEYFELQAAAGRAESGPPGIEAHETACVAGPLAYTGRGAIRQQIAHFTSSLAGAGYVDAFLTAPSPGVIERYLTDEHYTSEESMLFAVADALHEEYQAIAGAGLVLQIEAPDLLDAWQQHPELSVPRYQDYLELQVEALNRALRGIPPDMVRLQLGWGDDRGPHVHDIPLKEVIGLIYKVNAGAYAVEAANPRHEHEWTVFRDAPLPDGKILIAGVVGPDSDRVEHPELVAQRLMRYAVLVGREHLIAGTDCGLGDYAGHPDIVWAKLRALAEGAHMASRELWGR